MKHFWMTLIGAASLLPGVACGGDSPRRAALRHKQDSSLLAAQQELAVVDSTLEAVKAQYERMKAEVEQHKADLCATEEELTGLTLLRMRRDSLQVQWDVLGAKIRYIRQKQTELPK